MGRAKGVVDVDLTQFGQLCAQGVVALGLPGVKAQVLQEQYLARRERAGMASTLGPMQSGAMATSRPKSSARRLATGARVSSGTTWPLGLPM